MKKTKRIYLDNRGYKTVINKNVKNRIVKDEVNPAMKFIKGKSKDYFKNKPVNQVYQKYKHWCEQNNLNYNRNMIRNTIIENFGVKAKNIRIDGKPTRCFAYNEEN